MEREKVKTMAAKQHQQQQVSGDGVTSHIAGISKSQLYDIMSQMKVLIDQNDKQARKILIDNPLLTRALFQAQIMLGMVQPPQVMPNIQQQGLSQSTQAGQKPVTHTTQAVPDQARIQGQKSLSQPPVPARQQLPQHVSIAVPSTSVPPLNYQSQQMISTPAHLAPQAKGYFGAPSATPPQSSLIHSIPLPSHTHSHYSMLQPHMPMVSSQAPPSLQTHGMIHQPLQPPLPQHPRPSLQPFSQISSQMTHHHSFQPSNAPQQLFSQPLFHSGGLPLPSFLQGQPPLPSHPPPQQLYQGGPVMGSDYRNQPGTFMHAERGPWMRGFKEKSAGGQLPGLPQLSLGQITATHPAGQPPRLPLLSPEMEKVVLQQVLMLTPEQINQLPPEQRNQVLEIQEILR